MSSKIKISVVLFLSLVVICCSDPEAPKKGITRYYVTKITMPDGWEDQFHYANDTLIEKIQLYNNGTLIATHRPTWVGDNTFAVEARGYPLNEIISIRKFTLADGAVSNIDVLNFYPSTAFKYDFSFDVQSRLDSYIYSGVESGKATWLTDSVSVLQTVGTKSKVFGVKFNGGSASPWSGLSIEALATIMFQEINIIECFVPGKINTLGSSSYGYYKYDEYLYDSENNITSLRRTNTTTGKFEYFKFEWKKVLL